MKLPTFVGQKRSINLLPRDAFESSTLGVILEWALVFGKWAVIFTQLIVMGAFIYRFTLDRTLSDLNKLIAKNVAVIKSYDQVERDFIIAQKQVAEAKQAMDTQATVLKTLSEIQKMTPNEVWYDRITISPGSIVVAAYAANLPGFGQFLTNIEINPLFEGVRVSRIESSSSQGASMQFDVTLTLASSTIKPGARQ